MFLKKLKLIPSLAIVFIMAIMGTGCAEDDGEEIVTVCPTVLSTIPTDGDVDVLLDQVISAIFTGELNPETVNSETFKVKANGDSSIAGTVSYEDMTASFAPETNLLPFTLYQGNINLGIKDPYGNALQQQYVWSFTTIPEVSLSVSPDDTGTVSGAGLFNNESLVTVEATPNEGFVFSNWTIDDVVVSTDAIYEFEVNGNMALVANFEVANFILTVNAVNGSVDKNPDQATYDSGSQVILTATPDAGYEFSSWSDDATGTDNPLTIVMDSSKTVTANFTLIPINTFTLTVNAENGSVTKNPDEPNYEEGTDVVLTATPDAGYQFSSWSGDASGNNNPLTVTMDADKVITANFTLVSANTFTLTVNAENGSVTKNPDESNYEEGTDVVLTATPDAGYQFSSWSGDASGNNNPLTITMDADKVITANFTLISANTFTLTVNAENGSVTKNPDELNYEEGTDVVLTATPAMGYEFDSWSGDASGNNNPLTVTMDADKVITANFTLISANTFTLTVNAENGSVTKNPDEPNYEEGTDVVLTATPDMGYEFDSWSGDASGNNNPLTVTMDADKVITANFTLISANTFTLTVNAENGSVTKNPDESNYEEGTDVVLTATPDMGYEFDSWSGDASGNNNPLTITMDADKVITANFTLISANTFTLTVNAQNGSVTKNPDELNYEEGTDVVLTATPDMGYEFSSWSGDASGNNNPLTITMDADKFITANFTQVNAGPQGIDLNSAGDFVVLGGAGISNTGVTTMLTGDVGSFPTATITGMDETNVNGILYTTANPIVDLAKSDLTDAYNDGQSRVLNAISLPGQLGGLTLAPGLYVNSTSTGISGTGPQGILTLNGTANDVWIFKMGSTLITDSNTSIVLTGGASADNIYWIVGTSATLGTNSIFYGNVLSNISVTLNTGAVVNGRILTRTGAVSLDSNIATKP